MHSPQTAHAHAIGANSKHSVFLALLFLMMGTLLCAPATAGGDEHPTLAIGSVAPDFLFARRRWTDPLSQGVCRPASCW